VSASSNASRPGECAVTTVAGPALGQVLRHVRASWRNSAAALRISPPSPASEACPWFWACSDATQRILRVFHGGGGRRRRRRSLDAVTEREAVAGRAKCDQDYVWESLGLERKLSEISRDRRSEDEKTGEFLPRPATATPCSTPTQDRSQPRRWRACPSARSSPARHRRDTIDLDAPRKPHHRHNNPPTASRRWRTDDGARPRVRAQDPILTIAWYGPAAGRCPRASRYTGSWDGRFGLVGFGNIRRARSRCELRPSA